MLNMNDPICMKWSLKCCLSRAVLQQVLILVQKSPADLVVVFDEWRLFVPA